MDTYELALALAGSAALLAAWLPQVLQRRPLSVPIVLVGIGLAAFALPIGLPKPDPIDGGQLVERLTELGVIVALMGAGLKLDRPLGWRSWASTWRMLAIAMPLTIAAVALVGWALAGLVPASALLLGAALAPTDPVLASDVQVGEPSIADAPDQDQPPEEDEVRFTLTSEAGLNDALAFPFTYLAILMATKGTNPSRWIIEWVAVDVVFRLAAGLVIGILLGKLLGKILFHRPDGREGLAAAAEGFMVLGATLLAYGLTELLQGYGFLAVFVTAVVLRRSESRHEYHRVLHGFANQVEQVFTVLLLLLFGGVLAGGLLRSLTWGGAAVAAVTVLAIRPLAGLVALARGHDDKTERLAISFFGVRGIGSLYYLSYALSEARFPGDRELWAITAATIVLSIAVHGITAAPLMSLLDRRRDTVTAAT
ncbi:MAG TPA: cation:proton antiporter [Acidimicrobiales bacterium]|nr:cation:proton antiporter [Acidimicrobiales bacterium]